MNLTRKLAAIREYDQRGFRMTPTRGKRPFRTGWQTERLNLEQLAEIYSDDPGQNIGVLNGEPSGGIVDIDLDHHRAIELADEILPPTNSVFGRIGKPRSHRLYYVTAPVETQQHKLPDIGMLVELRSTGTQTVFPGSIHESGEPIEWSEDGEPAQISPTELSQAVERLAQAARDALGVATTPAPKVNGQRHRGTPNRSTIVERARRHIAKDPPAIQGCNGSDAAFHVASELFRYGLTDEEARCLFDDFNSSCVPPWSAKEIDHKLRDAREEVVRAGEFGCRLQVVSPARDNGHASEFTPDEPPPPIERFTLRNLRVQYPHLHPPLIEGLLRDRETANIISVSKIGKSWLAYSLLLSVATGRPWFRFPTQQGRVLLIDNELHRPTLANRIYTVGGALEIRADQYEHVLDIWPLRGQLRNINEIDHALRAVDSGTYKLIVLDAKYRALPPGNSENDNAAETAFYNTVDGVAERLQAAVVMIHHSTKGSQTEKRVTDVGAGAGAQSRAADCHLILREHEKDGAVVLEAAVRSFAPVEPLTLRWDFPLWVADDSLDPTRLKAKLTGQEERQSARDQEADDQIWEFCSEWRSRAEMKRHFGWSEGRLDRGIRRLVDAHCLTESEETRRGNQTTIYRRT